MRGVRYIALVCLLLGVLVPPTASNGAEPDPLVIDSLAALAGLVDKDSCSARDAADDDAGNGLELPYVFCDDGLPASGGGAGAIPVPVKYFANESGDDWTGLPRPATEAEAADAIAADDLKPESGNRISLDVDISLPPSAIAATVLGTDPPPFSLMPAPPNGFPVIVFMHGCCGGSKKSWEATTVDAEREQWHHSNAWFASRGYVVVNYTARGFRNSNDQGSTGSTQLDSRRYEINDYQYLVGLLADSDRSRLSSDTLPLFGIDPKKIATVGGSYGGGFAWLALTDPTWLSPGGGFGMSLAAAVPKYGWTDLVEALVPSGHYLDRDPQTQKRVIAPTDPATALSRDPIGVEKQSIVTGLFASGNLVQGDHTTFPEWLSSTYGRLQQGEPYDGDATIESVADRFLNDRSAYYQNAFWKRVSKGLRVPIYSAATWTDPLFPTMEHMRFYNKLKSLTASYPITTYLGDYQHFVQNKAKEWDDLCGDDHHVCTIADYKRPDGSLNLMKSPLRVRKGINFSINKFLDFYLKGRGKKPKADVTATTTICPANATDVLKADEPGITYRAPTWSALTPTLKSFSWTGGGTTTTAAVDGHAGEADPVARDRQTDKCHTTSQTNPGPGVVQFTHNPLDAPFTMMGLPTMYLDYETTATDYWFGVRMYDRDPDGSMTMVTRGVCRVNTAANADRTCAAFELWGNAWVFETGHQVVVEVSQSDSPFLRKDNVPSMATINKLVLKVPIAPDSLRRDFRFPGTP
ncbi:MAG: type transport system ATP-binding protein [Actinomycetota bacterium]|jgi:predicted acyl esterase|nr:type transport system ATP-binding protein [Actinomycetota bacterium]